jgi:hypothetical protein
MIIEIIDGDLFEQDVDCIVNAWNRNIIPWCNYDPAAQTERVRVGNSPLTGCARRISIRSGEGAGQAVPLPVSRRRADMAAALLISDNDN